MEARNEAEELHKSPQYPKKSKRKINIMEETKTIWEGKGYESLGKCSQNQRHQYANRELSIRGRGRRQGREREPRPTFALCVHAQIRASDGVMILLQSTSSSRPS